MPPELLLFNIEPGTKEAMLVVGKYNAEVCRGFKQPVIALLREWRPEYRYKYHLNQIERFEFVISRVVPTSTATYAPTRDTQRAAETSANFENNVAALKSLAADPQVRQRCVISRGGVFETAQERYHFRENWSLCQKYLSKFQPCPQIDYIGIIDDFCRPPKQVASGVMFPSYLPTAKTPLEWEMMSPEEKARVLFAHQEEMLSKSTPLPTTSSGAVIVVPQSPISDANDWKGQPALSREDIAELRSDSWKRY